MCMCVGTHMYAGQRTTSHPSQELLYTFLCVTRCLDSLLLASKAPTSAQGSSHLQLSNTGVCVCVTTLMQVLRIDLSLSCLHGTPFTDGATSLA